MVEQRDPIAVAPDIYKVLFENDRVRVLEITMGRGAKSDMHWHPDSVAYVLSGGEASLTLLDGTAVDMKIERGEVVWQPAGNHALTSTGTSEVKAIAVELK